MQNGGQQEIKKTQMFGIVQGTNGRGRPYTDIVSWCKTELQELNSFQEYFLATF